MNDNETRRLAHAINELRPDWPISSLTTFIGRSLSNRTYRDASVALAWIATDMRVDGTPASDTPKRVLEAGPWWQAAAVGGANSVVQRPPKPSEECPKHVGKWADNCGGCRADALAGEGVTGSENAPSRRVGHSGYAAAIRSQLWGGD